VTTLDGGQKEGMEFPRQTLMLEKGTGIPGYAPKGNKKRGTSRELSGKCLSRNEENSKKKYIAL